VLVAHCCPVRVLSVVPRVDGCRAVAASSVADLCRRVRGAPRAESREEQSLAESRFTAADRGVWLTVLVGVGEWAVGRAGLPLAGDSLLRPEA
jgi:hypothetical protein